MMGTLVKCSLCGSQVDGDNRFCPICGEVAPGLGDSRDVQVSALLATANHHRVKKEWKQAESECQQALDLQNGNALAHSLMGDILRDQGKFEDAAAFFEMALELEPDNDRFLHKLEKARPIARTQQHASSSNSGAASVGKSYLRINGLLQDESTNTLIKLLALVFVTLMVVTVLYKLSNHKGNQPVKNDVPHTPQQQVPSTGPVPTQNMIGAQNSNPVTPPPATLGASSGATATPVENALIDRIKSWLEKSGVQANVTGGWADPRDQSITVVFTSQPNKNSSENKRLILESARMIALAAFNSEPQSKSVTIRANQSLPDSSGSMSQQLAFVGDASQQSVSTKAPESADLKTLEKMFDSVFWHPALGR